MNNTTKNTIDQAVASRMAATLAENRTDLDSLTLASDEFIMVNVTNGIVQRRLRMSVIMQIARKHGLRKYQAIDMLDSGEIEFRENEIDWDKVFAFLVKLLEVFLKLM